MNADLILKNCNYLDCINRCFCLGDIAIKDGYIVGINGNYKSLNIVDLSGKYVVPGFIDGHIHLESSIIAPYEFLKTVCLHGTTSLITDPHEICNVCGVDGIKYILESTNNMPVSVFVMIPSCVPATPFDIIKQPIDSVSTENIFNDLMELYPGRILGLAEMMNYPGVIFEDKEVLSKINSSLKRGLRVDGHSPSLSGEKLLKYILSGISSDHECVDFLSAKERLDIAKKYNKDFVIAVREGTAAKNRKALSKLLNYPLYQENVIFCTDDKHPEEFDYGHIDAIVRDSILKDGINPIDALIASSYNAAKHYNLNDRGLITNGYLADLVVLDDLNNIKINSVYKSGVLLDKNIVDNWKIPSIDSSLLKNIKSSINMKKISISDINIDKDTYYQVIEVIPGEIITKDCGVVKGFDDTSGLIKSIVFESHAGTNKKSIVFIKGLDINNGAIGTTVSHDSHYMVVCGTNDLDIVDVTNKLIDMQGGMAYSCNGVIETLALPIANLMTDDKSINVVKKIRKIKSLAYSKNDIDPFMNLSFLSLGVIGDIKNLPVGVIDVNEFRILSQEDLKKKYKESK